VYERNYPPSDFELVVVVFAIMIWRHNLHGLNYEVLTDHHSSQHVSTQKFFSLAKAFLC
jgi:hypothetical protein